MGLVTNLGQFLAGLTKKGLVISRADVDPEHFRLRENRVILTDVINFDSGNRDYIVSENMHRGLKLVQDLSPAQDKDYGEVLKGAYYAALKVEIENSLAAIQKEKISSNEARNHL